MALDQYSLAALIQQQMGGSAPALDMGSKTSDGANYFWNALSNDFRRARVVARMVAKIPEAGRATARGRVGYLEAV